MRKIQVKQNNGATPYYCKKLSTCTQTIIWLLKIGDYAHCGGNERDSRAIMKGQKVHCIVLYRNYSDQNPRLTIHSNKDRFKLWRRGMPLGKEAVGFWWTPVKWRRPFILGADILEYNENNFFLG